MEDTKNIRHEDLEAYKTVLRVCTPGIQNSDVLKTYSEWAGTYDETMSPGRYNAPQIAAEATASLVPEESRQHVRILDVAAGTGRVGKELHQRGFRMIDALEPSRAMLNILEETGVYSTKYMEFIGLGQNSIPDNTYDMVVVAGGMVEGHLPVEAVDDMIRVVKPGGLVVNAMRLEYLEEVEAYRDKLEPYMDLLQQKGRWQMVQRKVVPDYAFTRDGVIFVHRVL